jgi:HEAT repeat protein
MATLEELLKSPDQSVRLKAALAAGTYPEAEYIEILVTQCSHEPDFFRQRYSLVGVNAP